MDQIQEEIIEEFSIFEDWLDKYDYLIGWSAFPLRRGKVRGPKGGSNPCGRILNDRAALSREFPRN